MLQDKKLSVYSRLIEKKRDIKTCLFRLGPTAKPRVLIKLKTGALFFITLFILSSFLSYGYPLLLTPWIGVLLQ